MNVNPFSGPLPMVKGVDIVGGECPPPSAPITLVDYPSSEGSIAETVEPENPTLAMLNALDLVARRVPTPIMELGSELLSIDGLPHTDFIFHPGMSVIMPSESCELVRNNQSQFYRIPAIHCATGNMLYLLTPIEMGPPAVIFAKYTQFRALTRPLPPFDCDWLNWTEQHRVQLISRCVCFP